MHLPEGNCCLSQLVNPPFSNMSCLSYSHLSTIFLDLLQLVQKTSKCKKSTFIQWNDVFFEDSLIFAPSISLFCVSSLYFCPSSTESINDLNLQTVLLWILKRVWLSVKGFLLYWHINEVKRQAFCYFNISMSFKGNCIIWVRFTQGWLAWWCGG